MSALLGCVKALFEGFAPKNGDNRPIGLKYLTTTSDDDVLNQLARPTRPMPPLAPDFVKKRVNDAAPAFAYTPPSGQGFQNYQEFTRHPRYSRR